ncbi:extracellular solute-binding protein [Paenibacillus koleovorans]|uniref:extracellular solute-binding protein n=1 Tax=Paenibacillus koleovorans TaxID=121608 RepID=UPI000FDA19A5|nr:extracellular solute-binding protein [Paenibacillus koleovorans]
MKASKKTSKTAVMLTLSLAVALTSACTKESPSGSTETTPASSGSPKASEAVKADPFGKYETPIEFSTVRKEVEGLKFPAGQSLDKNIWTDSFEADLGIKVVNKWKVAANQYDQKLNVSIISDDLPDFLQVDSRQLQLLLEGGKLKDLTEAFDKYASPLLKQAKPKEDLDAATFKGKLMAIPAQSGGIDNAPMLWVRVDWLKKLNLPEPKTANDLFTIIDAFTNKDPDGNGKKDTFGLNLNKDIYSGFSGIDGFLNMYRAYGYNVNGNTMWVKDKEGKLGYGSIQPEMKQALAKLQELFKAGAIDPEFAVYDPAKSAENEMNNKTGIHFGTFSTIGWPLRDFKKAVPEGEWKPYPIPSIDGNPARPMAVTAAPSSFYIVNAKSKNPEALVKLLNYYYEKVVGPKQEPQKFHSTSIDGVAYTMFQYSPVSGGLPNTNLKAQINVSDALKTNDVSKLTPEEKNYFDAIQLYKKGDPAQYFRDRTFGPEGSYSVIGHYANNKLPLFNEFYGPPTKTMVDKGSTLKDMEIQTITKIITGSSIDEFDKFVKDWKSLGGDKIIEEVNAWYANKK